MKGRKTHHQTPDCVISKNSQGQKFLRTFLRTRTFLYRNTTVSLCHCSIQATMDPLESRRRRGGCMKFCGEYWALFVKMLLLTKRKRTQTIVEFLLAYVFLALLLGMRYLLDRNYYPARQMDPFRPFDTMLSNSTRANKTYYYPGRFYSIQSISEWQMFVFDQYRQFMYSNDCQYDSFESSSQCSGLSCWWYAIPRMWYSLNILFF